MKKLTRLTYLLVALPALILILQTCSEDRVTDVDLTDLSKVVDFLYNDAAGKSAYPRVWMDTISRFETYSKATEFLATINPLDYWVEVVAYGCTITIADSCAPDEYNEADSCAEIQLESGIRAKTYIANILDTMVCKYHIVERSDSSITTKTVKYKEVQTALMAKLEKNETQYGGWRLFAIGRQRTGLGYSLNSFPAVDSIVLQSRDRPEVRAVYYPTQRIRYTVLSKVPTLGPGEAVRITAYTRARFGNPPIRDAYLHYSINGTTYHEWMGGDVSHDPDRQIFEWDIYESSGQSVGLYNQIVIELFQEASLRETIPTAFTNLLWAMTYRLGQ